LTIVFAVVCRFERKSGEAIRFKFQSFGEIAMLLAESHAGKPASASQSEDASSVPFLVISGLALVLSIAVASMPAITGTANNGAPVTEETRKPVETRNPDLRAAAVIPRQGGESGTRR
jgi:hypothetical protein